jgi:hypothetical protein
MSPTIPVVALVVLVVVSLIAKERKYDMTGTGGFARIRGPC